MRFGVIVKTFRSERGLTQYELGEAIGQSKSVAKSYISQIERGTKIPSFDRAIDLAKELNAPIDLFLSMVAQDQVDIALKNNKINDDIELLFVGTPRTEDNLEPALLHFYLKKKLIACLASGKPQYFSLLFKKYKEEFKNYKTEMQWNESITQISDKNVTLKEICRIFSYLSKYPVIPKAAMESIERIKRLNSSAAWAIDYGLSDDKDVSDE